MKKLVKIALGAVAFLGITELFCVETVAIMWRKLMMRNDDSAADALDNGRYLEPHHGHDSSWCV